LASQQAKAAFIEEHKRIDAYAERTKDLDISAQRQALTEYFQPALKRVRALYPVDTVAIFMAGVPAQVITPKEGIARRNKNRVLINLSGGGFLQGVPIIGILESAPVANLGAIKVVTIDYRQAPEHRFPAASEDVAAVYRELLKAYKPQSIGIYGCSAGGVLTGEATAWISKEHLPRPGAIGIFCASAGGWAGGDSGYLALPLDGITPTPDLTAPPHPSISNVAYFADADLNDPLVEPIHSVAVLSKFPPTLIITSTRDIAMSPAIYTHTQLIKLGIDAELHVWEGLGHGFFTTQPDLPESKEVWDVVVKFFDQHLAAPRDANRQLNCECDFERHDCPPLTAPADRSRPRMWADRSDLEVHVERRGRFPG
jgi:acetyl esterase/lipase